MTACCAILYFYSYCIFPHRGSLIKFVLLIQEDLSYCNLCEKHRAVFVNDSICCDAFLFDVTDFVHPNNCYVEKNKNRMQTVKI